MNLIEESFREAFPLLDFVYTPVLKYSSKFKGYNASIHLRKRFEINILTLRLSRQWETVSDEIKKGLIQELLARLLKRKIKTINMEMYSLFLKNIHKAIPKIKLDEFLGASFDRVNELMFSNLLEKPNFCWINSSRILGHYEYGTDTIAISEVLREVKQELLDYVMYHEMLHKKHKFSSGNGRRHTNHPKVFRDDEAKYPDAIELERQLRNGGAFGNKVFVRKKKSYLLDLLGF